MTRDEILRGRLALWQPRTGYRFSVDYTPYLLLLFAIGGWSLRNRAVQAVICLGVLVNFWGAVAFRGYTELMRNW